MHFQIIPPLIFFGLLMGSPVPGFLILALIGIWTSVTIRRRSLIDGYWKWSQKDILIALSFMSIFLFKLLSAAWSSEPNLALANSGWHLYFLFWPLVFLGLNRFKTTQSEIDKAVAAGLVFVAIWRGTYALTDLPFFDPGPAGIGLLAQLAMTMGAWNLLALTRKDDTSKFWRVMQGVALPSTFIIIILTTRRQELLGFFLIFSIILSYRLRRHYSPLRAIVIFLLLLAILCTLIYIRWEKFATGINEVLHYFSHGNDEYVVRTSWGARLEMWRIGWIAFLDNPWIGLSASVRPLGLQYYGAPPAEFFQHRHFHQHLLQVLVEGGIFGLFVFLTTLIYTTREMIIKPFKNNPETALLSAALLASFIMEGLVSAPLVYDKPNALLVITSAWVWLQLRRSQYRSTTNQ